MKLETPDLKKIADTFDISYKVSQAMEELRSLKYALADAREEISELNVALLVLKNFAISRGLDLSLIGYEVGQNPLGQKASELPKEEVLGLNEGVAQRQAGKRADSLKKLAQPTIEELEELYKERNNEAILAMANGLEDDTLETIAESQETKD
jgi:hypothetical protein